MTAGHIAAAMQHYERVLQRKPAAGLHDDVPATAQWNGGMRLVTRHPDGVQLVTDMPAKLGGTGDEVTPGWLFRAGLASCAATCILMAAAADGIELERLEVKAGSRSDTRGLLGLCGADGKPVYSGPDDLHLQVRVAAKGVEPARLRAVIETGIRRSPVPNAVMQATPLALHIDIVDG